MAAAKANAFANDQAGDGLTEFGGFSPNPGGLRARMHVPYGLEAGAPLVVALHGCTQSAAAYDGGTGWSTLADRQGFAVLFPEQVQANNANRCFNWFSPEDIRRTGGEAESIAAMVAAMIARHDIDPRRVFVTGLSAGGAMTAVMLATYPEMFVGGAVIGGLPYGSATSVPEAFARMRGQSGGDDDRLLAVVRQASNGYRGRQPSLSIWHGTQDATVNVGNMDGLGRQWRHLHGLDTSTPSMATGPGWERRRWGGEGAHAAVEEWRIAGMGHGVPIDPSGPSRLGASGPFMFDVGLSSTAEIARGWGLLSGDEGVDAGGVLPAVRVVDNRRPAVAERVMDATPADVPRPNGIQATIEDALRKAGLMR